MEQKQNYCKQQQGAVALVRYAIHGGGTVVAMCELPSVRVFRIREESNYFQTLLNNSINES